MSTREDRSLCSATLWSSCVPIHVVVPFFPTLLSLNTDMSEDPGVQFMGARSKRTHRQMSQESSEGGQPSWHHHFHPPRPDMSGSRPARLPPMRTPRDGFDFRRPAEITPQEGDVIDLTNEPETPPRSTQPRIAESRSPHSARLPRFGRNIMAEAADVVDLEDDRDNAGEGPSSSPEVQFVRATTVRQQPPPRRWDPLSLFQTNLPLPRPRHHSEMHHFGAYPRPPRHGIMPSQVDALFLGTRPTIPNLGSPDVLLDYALSSFSMEPVPGRNEERRRRDTYKAPSPVPEGFSRTLGEDDIAICPNCNWELGTGEGKKQEIWVAKQCGHVYCGECAENRSLSKAKKTQATQRTKPFSKCQVEGCGKPVSAPTAMLHLYL
ncbi:uncharacterized protein N7482_007206 [Penicillium canariense]|uniref:Uncharacterized protein n=1 Tax=Penicillium canariense TaxID=189055 RepID=A0A9W9LIW3_9EURO|nr:uncharacterized protein N7482_007206 [Penicillium canariense]KAJ5160202.1 hypothetical protein N7482_007206 [Penicillium canariense]